VLIILHFQGFSLVLLVLSDLITLKSFGKYSRLGENGIMETGIVFNIFSVININTYNKRKQKR